MSGILGIPIFAQAVAAVIDSCEANTTVVGCSGGNCGTCTNCVAGTESGSFHCVRWDETGCVDAGQHIAIRLSIDGGTPIEVADDLACQEGAASGCPDNCPGGFPLEGFRIVFAGKCGTDLLNTITYDYTVRIETDGTDNLINQCAAAQKSEKWPAATCIDNPC